MNSMVVSPISKNVVVRKLQNGPNVLRWIYKIVKMLPVPWSAYIVDFTDHKQKLWYITY